MPNTPTTLVSTGSPSGKRSARRFFVLDGLPLIFQYYYARGQRARTPDGEPAGVTYRFCQMLMDLVSKQKPDYLAVVIDDQTTVSLAHAGSSHAPHRKKLPAHLVPQIRRILEILVSQRVHILSAPGRETGDLIATLVRRVTDLPIQMMLVSRNKTLHQLLGRRVSMFDPISGEIMGQDELWATHGYRPEQTVDILTLNRVQRIKQQRAVQLIGRYGTAQAVIDHADQFKQPVSQNLLAFRPQLAKVRESLTLKTDVPLDFDLEACRWRGFEHEALSGIFRRLGFGRMEKRGETALSSDGTVHEAISPGLEHLSKRKRRHPGAKAKHHRGGADGQAASRAKRLTSIIRAEKTGFFMKTDLKQRGWTDRMIREFIPEPHARRTNPHSKYAAPVCLYRLDVVKGIENTEAFRSRAAEARKRGAAASRRR